ncbi:MAG: hypothetical protein CMJ50_02290 [Planctomycetaceae bacterium]|nr:hypothetical protein [Planctomycetaceae bacterium]
MGSGHAQRDEAMRQIWRGPARSYDGDEVTFVVSVDPNEPELHAQTVSGEHAKGGRHESGSLT